MMKLIITLTIVQFILFIWFIFFIVSLFQPYNNSDFVQYTPNSEATQMVDLTNYYRVTHNLLPLTLSDRLTSSAQQKADMICITGVWDHTDFMGRPFSYLITSVGYDYTSAGENLARGYTTESLAFGALLRSPEHYANIVGNYKDIGVGFNSCGGKNYTVIHYGRL